MNIIKWLLYGLFCSLTTDDAFWCRLTLATCYQFAQSVLRIGSALAERVGQGEVGGCTPLGDSAWQLLQLAVEKSWSMPGGPLGDSAWQLLQLAVEKPRSVPGGPFVCVH